MGKDDVKKHVLFEHEKFIVYLHENTNPDEAPFVLQVCMKTPKGGGEQSGGDDATAPKDSTVTGPSEEEILCEEAQTYLVKRKESGLYVEFVRDLLTPPPPALPTPKPQTGGGCWYLLDEESDGDGDSGSNKAPLPPTAETPKLEKDNVTTKPAATNQQQDKTTKGDGCTKGPDQTTNGNEKVAAKSEADNSSKIKTVLVLLETLRESRPSARPVETVGEECVSQGGGSCWYFGDEKDLPTEGPHFAFGPAPRRQTGDDHADQVDLLRDVADAMPHAMECVWYLGASGEPDDLPGALPTSTAQKRPGSTQDVGGDASNELRSLSESKVEWKIWGITSKLKHYPKGSRIFSPEFDAFGVSGLGLVFYPNGNSSAKQGFCSLGLKAPHGTHLRYKLYIGGTERFTDLRHNVTESWGFVDMCKVEDELHKEEDSLRLGVEIIDVIDTHETLKNVSTNKVEWVINNMPNKLNHYRKDQALYSDEFSAGGVEKLRLKFYPCGKKEADEGWCSLYLEAPKGSELRCRLSVGKKSMSFDRLEKFGEDSIWGFLTLCKLRDELEQDGDSVRVGLEVLETKRLDGRLSEAEDAYLKTLNVEKRTFLLNELDRIEKLKNNGDGSVPSRFRILQLELPDSAKAVALSKLDAMHSDVLSGESSKLKKWIDGLLSIPFGQIRKPLVSLDAGKAQVHNYLEKAHSLLDAAVFGHEEPKQKIVQLLCQWIANPTSMSLVLGIQGPPGNGKTTLCRKGIAEALERPFVQISLGGATDASVLEGHSYTYVGSTWGRIAGLIMEAQCMNPVIFFDELDKVSDTPRGEEIIGVLTHLTDHSQNKTFTDRYFEGIPFDLSRALFIFSFNDESKLNAVLKDRLTLIHTQGFDFKAKQKISKEYLLPELLANVGLNRDDIRIAGDELNYLCQRNGVPTEEGGVRGIKQSLEAVILKVNQLRMTQEDSEEETLSKADAESNEEGKQKADGGEKLQKADGEHKKEELNVTAKAAGEVKDGEKAGSAEQAGNDKGKEAEKSNDKEKGSEKEVEKDTSKDKVKEKGSDRRADGEKKKKKEPRIDLPLTLTKELIEELISAKPRDKMPQYMYI